MRQSAELNESVLAVRQNVVAAALSQLGTQDPLKYWRGVLPDTFNEFQLELYAKSRDWCGGFALWCLKEAGLASDITWQDGRGFCYELTMTTEPKPGDVAYFAHPYQHHAIVESYDRQTGVLVSIDGNQGAPTVPGTKITAVSERERRATQATAFYSIESLIQTVPG